ncbi:hypothetical protein Catovirus_2_17 [Catovirus CTV1]|uniref:Uncharacterized protein n=1 Tax=Catovirus CTV1 TaxID=1977631 RepID=A0A1V0SBN9_9VIRU|nr:hypothetical protein Catovirus_2_17 [Catovirus CTV1]
MDLTKNYEIINQNIFDLKKKLKNYYNNIYDLEFINVVSIKLFDKYINNKILLIVKQIIINTKLLIDIIDKREKLILSNKYLLNPKYNIVLDNFVVLQINDPIFDNISSKYEFEKMCSTLTQKYYCDNWSVN